MSEVLRERKTGRSGGFRCVVVRAFTLILAVVSLLAPTGDVIAARRLRWYEAYDKAKENLERTPLCNEEAVRLLRLALSKRRTPSPVATRRSKIRMVYAPHLLLAEAHARCERWAEAAKEYARARKRGSPGWIGPEEKKLTTDLENRIRMMTMEISGPSVDSVAPPRPAQVLERRKLRLIIGASPVLSCESDGPVFDEPSVGELAAKIPRKLPDGLVIRCGEGPGWSSSSRKRRDGGVDEELTDWWRVLQVAEAVEVEASVGDEIDLGALAGALAFGGAPGTEVARLAQSWSAALMSYRTFKYRRQLNEGIERAMRWRGPGGAPR